MGQKMNSERAEYLSFHEIIWGILFAPIETAALITSRQRAVVSSAVIIISLVTLWLPPFSQSLLYGYDIPGNSALFRLTYVFLATLLIFVFFDSLILHAFRREANLGLTLSCASFAIAPLLVGAALIYLINLATTGRLTIATILLLGFGQVEYPLNLALPYIGLAVCSYSIIIFTGALQGSLNMSLVPASVATLLSLLPFTLACLLGLISAEVFWPGTMEIIMNITGEI